MTTTGTNGPRVFASHTSTDQWEPDVDVGDNGLMHVLCLEGRHEAGLTRLDEADGSIVWIPPERESFLVLEGSVHIEIEGAPSIDVATGGFASLPKGAVTTWHITTPFREFWVMGAE